MDEKYVTDKLELLKFAIKDAQDIIRFTEAKAAFCITIITGHLIALYAMLDNLTKPNRIFDWDFWLLLIVLLSGHVLFVYLVYRIIMPKFNPQKQLNFDSEDAPKINIFLSNDKLNWYQTVFTSNAKIQQSYGQHVTLLKESSAEDMINTLTFELHKVSYIRNIKIDRLKILTRITLIVSVVFILVLLSYFIHVNTVVTPKVNCH